MPCPTAPRADCPGRQPSPELRFVAADNGSVSMGGGEKRITAQLVACVVVALALPVLWLLGFDFALPLAAVLIVLASPLGVAAIL